MNFFMINKINIFDDLLLKYEYCSLLNFRNIWIWDFENFGILKLNSQKMPFSKFLKFKKIDDDEFQYI